MTNDEDEYKDIPPLVDDDLEAEQLLNGPAGCLVMQQKLVARANYEDISVQRENIFYTHFLIMNKVCSLIINSGSCTNVASLLMVEKLGLSTNKHPKPYRLQWFNEDDDVRIFRQA